MPFLSTLESVICRQLAASPAEKPHRAAAGAKTGQVIYFPSRAGKWPVQGLTGQFPRGPPGGSALPNSSATYGRRGNDSLPPGSEGVAFHDPTAWRYLVFHDPPAPIWPPCASEFRTRSSRKSSKIWTTVPMRQFVATAARRERVAWGPPSSRACGYPWALLAPIPSASSLPPSPLCEWGPGRDRCRPAAGSKEIFIYLVRCRNLYQTKISEKSGIPYSWRPRPQFSLPHYLAECRRILFHQ